MKLVRCVAWLSWFGALCGVPQAAWAVSIELSPPVPTLHGEPSAFAAELLDASPDATVRWDFGDGTETEFLPAVTSIEHAYDAPGHYSVTVLADDAGAFASASFIHTVYAAPTEQRARASTTLLLDPERQLLIAANQDNASVTLVDLTTTQKLAEIPVFDDPIAVALAPDGRLWVLHRETYAVGIVDLQLREMVEFFRLPFASQPTGMVFGADGNAYVTLFALGEVAAIDGETHDILLRKKVAPSPYGITASGDGGTLWITRLISQGDHGEIYRLDPATLEVTARSDLALDTVSEDTDHSGRGLPNYLFSVAVTPDGKRAWIPSKKDNMVRGLERDGLALTQDTAVRPLVSILDLETDLERFEEHIDLDDRNLPRHVEFTAEGDWAFVSVYGSNLIELRDAFDRSFVTALRSDQLFGPVATVIDARSRLFAFGTLSRTLVVFDVSNILTGLDLATQVIAEIPLVEREKLSPEVLRGQQVFANAEDKRMASEGYLSCSSCHFDGFEDGRVWDFFDRGEGFRNTTSMLGRRGTGHGRLHWSGNFDEIQDFDNPIRAHQAGLGFISAEKWATGTVSDPLGDPKAGLDADLDALAAYVATFDVFPPSPFRNPDGTLTADAEAGRALFLARGCGSCHGGPEFTNSAEGQLHDVGTMTELSGQRLGGELLGIDTPTLLGIWQTAPYLHDGSAPTLRDVLTTRNPSDEHGVTSDLSEAQLDQIVAYLQQIDQGLPEVPLQLPASNGAGGSGGSDNAGGSGGADIASGGASSSGSASNGGGESGGAASGGEGIGGEAAGGEMSGSSTGGGGGLGSSDGAPGASRSRGCSLAQGSLARRASDTWGYGFLVLLLGRVRRRRPGAA